MIVRLPYGKTELTVELADDLDVAVIEQEPNPGLDDPLGALQEALRSPIGSEPLSCLVNSEDKVGRLDLKRSSDENEIAGWQ